MFYRPLRLFSASTNKLLWYDSLRHPGLTVLFLKYFEKLLQIILPFNYFYFYKEVKNISFR